MRRLIPTLWPLALMIGGVVVVLDNFLLIELDLRPYWPALLIVVALSLLLRGDIVPSAQAQTFGITRGSVESGSLEIESGEVDVQVRSLRKPGRLIAGQYTARSRPGLAVRNNHATLRMERGRTWWLSMADWDVGLSNDLPWDLLVSSYLGRLEVDLGDVQVGRAYISSGLGHVYLVCPDHAAGTLFARSTFGDVRLAVPPGTQARITVNAGPFARVDADGARFSETEPGMYVTHPDSEALDLDITASTVFGTITLS
ncbi:MAG: hypothetical protein GYB65_17530, partial [Chloroflexi bacterium]|nr:hypothetical protein [Chloroflexota bacterium]